MKKLAIIKLAATLILVATLFSCKEKDKLDIRNEAILLNNQNRLTEIIIYDVFTPSVASRIYVYSSFASYETIKFSKPGYTSIAEKLNGFKQMPVPEKGKSYNYTLAATKAFFTVVHKLVFSVDFLTSYEKKL